MFRLFVDARRAVVGGLTALLLVTSLPLKAGDGLTFDKALAIAQQHSPELVAELSRVAAAQHAQGPADALPDPTLILGLDNVPVEGDTRY
ncbi:MAG: TolC family protein, partial [Alcanivoracaceae bacterium]|nr:TolC family protein [Alcanivoracaceae bacterium]